MTLQNNLELQHHVNKSHNALVEIEFTYSEYRKGRIAQDEWLEKVEVQLTLFRSIQQQIAWIIDEILNEK